MTSVTFTIYGLKGTVTRTVESRDKDDPSVLVEETASIDMSYYSIEGEEKACQYFYDKITEWTESSSFAYTVEEDVFLGDKVVKRQNTYLIMCPQDLEEFWTDEAKMSTHFANPGNGEIVKD